ncbi:hypothetical protein M8C21_022276, partial [Ambrosia artemisiifolia]
CVNYVCCGYDEYETGGGIVEGKLNVHLVPHSHDDVGWLKTVDQYFVGSNNSIQGACVENVLDSVVMSLLRDPNRKFIFAEMAFFRRWWLLQSKKIKDQVKKLVSAGQNGGWCMHDEAATHYIDMIDQTTLGHSLIKSNFNVTPRAGWQIDPFGHSAVQAYLLGAELGFDSIHFARIDYQDRSKRKDDKSLEVIWRGSETFGSSSQIFTNVFPRHYSAPDGFNFEVSGDFEPVQDSPFLFDMNVKKRVNDFIDAALTQANVTRTNHIMWTMGDDFQYQYAESWFKQMDKLIHYVNKASRQLEYLAGRKNKGPNTFSLGDALGIAQHHDAVTGTAKQHTTDDYEKRLAIGASEAEAVVNSALSCLTSSTSNCTLSTTKSTFTQVIVAYNPLGWKRTDIIRLPVKDANFVVQDNQGNTIEAQFVEFDEVTRNLRSFYTEAYLGFSPHDVPKYWLLFQAVVPPLGWNTYFINQKSGKGGHISMLDTPQVDTVVIGQGSLKMLIYQYNKVISGMVAQLITRLQEHTFSIPMDHLQLLFQDQRMLYDDGRGVGEPLDESVCNKTTCRGLTIRGNYYMSVNKVGSGSRWRRTTGQEIYSPLLLAFAHENQQHYKASHSTISTTMDPNYSLPPNVALITLQELEDGSVLLRLAHLYEAAEDVAYSTLAKVELKKLFAHKTIKKIKETSLSANQDKSAIKRMPWKVEGRTETGPPTVRGGPVDPLALVVELGPMEIRTFILQI